MQASAAVQQTLATTPVPPAILEPKRLGDYLIEIGKLSREALDSALRVAQGSQDRLGSVLVKLGLVSERDLVDALEALLGLPRIAAGDYPDAPIYEEQIAAKFLKSVQALPIREEGEALLVAMVIPQDEYV
ncbi:MAG: type II secretion system protein GspE, partial [Gammaproteobacteria bacterium]